MTARPLVIIGAGGHGREIHDVIQADISGVVWDVIGYLDDAPSAVNAAAVQRRGAQLLGAVAELTGMAADVLVALGVGDSAERARVAARPELTGRASPVLVHRDATVGSCADLGPGTILWAGARISTGVRTGRHCHVLLNASIGHDSVLGDFASLYPAATVSGSVTIGRAATIGANAVVIQGRRIGDGAFVGAGAAVVGDVPDGAVVRGVPARER